MTTTITSDAVTGQFPANLCSQCHLRQVATITTTHRCLAKVLTGGMADTTQPHLGKICGATVCAICSSAFGSEGISRCYNHSPLAISTPTVVTGPNSTTATTTNHVVAPNAVIPTAIAGPNATAAFTTSRVAAPAVILTEKQKKADAKKELDERRIAHIF